MCGGDALTLPSVGTAISVFKVIASYVIGSVHVSATPRPSQKLSERWNGGQQANKTKNSKG